LVKSGLSRRHAQRSNNVRRLMRQSAGWISWKFAPCSAIPRFWDVFWHCAATTDQADDLAV